MEDDQKFLKLARGDVIGQKYEIEELLGDGMLGTLAVSAATFKSSDSPVATRVVRPREQPPVGAGRLPFGWNGSRAHSRGL